MKICFIGLGSIGKRHIRNLVCILNERNIKFTIDAVRSSETPLESEIQQLVNRCYFDFEIIPSDYDIIFITNPTFMHYETLVQVIDKTKHIFLEKPVFHTIQINKEKLKYKSDTVYYVACPLRYHPVIRYVKEFVKEHSVFSVRAICSSYLPNWRKGVDYRKTYSAYEEQGGGVSLDLIHEWDYIRYIFGQPLQVFNIQQKCSQLEITSEDISVYIAKYSDKVVEVHLDYFGKKNTREVMLYTSDEVVRADVINNIIYFYGNKEKQLQLEYEDMYLNEMNHFLDLIVLGLKNENNIEDAYETLKIAIGEEEK